MKAAAMNEVEFVALARDLAAMVLNMRGASEGERQDAERLAMRLLTTATETEREVQG